MFTIPMCQFIEVGLIKDEVETPEAERDFSCT